MTAIARLYQTTAFKLSLIYLLVFGAFAGFLIVYFAHNTGELLSRQHIRAMDDEIQVLNQFYRRGGIRRLVQAIDRQSRRPNAGLYLVMDPQGQVLVGNIASVPAEVLDRPGTHTVPYWRIDEDDERDSYPALVRSIVLDNGFRILVGRDISEAQHFRDLIRRAVLFSVALMLVLAVVSGFFISRRVLRRMEGVTIASQAIMAGDLTGRIPVNGNQDEFDRLAVSLNRMLDRIEALMAGLTEVSDNVAHDLKTPLTRTRNRLEDILRTKDKEPEEYRSALEDTLVECDGLIETFNALLSIARAEAGETGGMEPFDAAAMVSDLGELYEPVAEEAGLTMTVDVEGPIPWHGNRHLLGQALSNLVDNALKYAVGKGSGILVTSRVLDGELVLTVADDGAGIPQEDRARVIERFVRLDQSRTEPGSGLGLSLVRAAALRHGGRFVLEDNAPGLRAELRIPPADLEIEV